MISKDNIKNISYAFIIIPFLLCLFGIVFAYSAGIKPDGSNTNQYIKQLVWVVLSIGLFVLILNFDYYQLVETSGIYYIVGITLLVITFLFGKEIRGSKSWLGLGGLGIQPSEIMKIFYIIFFAKYLANAPVAEKRNKVFLFSFLIMSLPLGLVMLQPDLGTSIVYIIVFFTMYYLGSYDDFFIKYLLIIGISLVILILSSAFYRFYYLEMGGKPIIFLDVILNFNSMIIISITMLIYAGVALVLDFFNPVEIISKLLPITLVLAISFGGAAVSQKILKPYQWKRLLVFINPEFDKHGAGYNIIQSKIAIGSGGFYGKGLFRGTQNNLGFLPEKNTDFIFSIISEELGFIGSGIIILLFGLYFFYIIRVILSAKDKEGMLIASGILAMFFTHFTINIGMNLGIAPVTGLPLPFVSYGGSSLMTFVIASALILNIYSRRYVH